MYLFVAHYSNMDTDEEVSRTIELDSQFYGNEREVYIWAMRIAYDKKQVNECFESLEFIAC